MPSSWRSRRDLGDREVRAVADGRHLAIVAGLSIKAASFPSTSGGGRPGSTVTAPPASSPAWCSRLYRAARQLIFCVFGTESSTPAAREDLFVYGALVRLFGSERHPGAAHQAHGRLLLRGPYRVHIHGLGISPARAWRSLLSHPGARLRQARHFLSCERWPTLRGNGLERLRGQPEDSGAGISLTAPRCPCGHPRPYGFVSKLR
jgi:hypothetical protein